ncbi:helix-turn-helix domain-containing protein [[Clostridium] colinum]|uniref:helix-turn-helix domain-containing protein n=1 Tax=[Clostridium] colinum TaxID=36835 RepID=UPI002025235E|nr:helix-turn-helix domain-containing protein [[Clostridium] colinum]
MYFFEILENIMSDRNLKISDISKMTDIPDSTLRSIINRKNKTVALDVAFKISKGLNIPIEELNNKEDLYYKNTEKKECNKINNIKIGERIKTLREEKGITQDELATKLGYTSRSSIAKIESGKTDISQSKVKEIAEILNTTTSYLIDGTENILTQKDEKDIAKKMDSLIEQIDTQDALMFDGEPLDEESKELLKASLENSLRMAKAIAKQKYTPKKYKK